MLTQAIEALSQRVEKLEAAFVVIDELEWDIALTKARKYFRASHREKIYPTDLADFLGTSISQAADICAALEAEGVVVGQ